MIRDEHPATWLNMWVLVFSTCNAITLVVVLVLCSCWKRKRQKDDLQGLDGMVTQKNPDENVNHLPAATMQSAPENVKHEVTDELDATKRPVTASNTRRSLPDIPSEGQTREDGVWEPADNTSVIYATVEPYNNTAKRHTLPNGIDSRPSISQHSSISQADDAPYASVNYEKLSREHPYAIVKSVNNTENDISEEPTARTALLQSDLPNTSTLLEPLPPPRSRRSSAQSSTTADINAASAVAGGIAASQELPYMTPPIGPVAQTNFSGDSQDSSKGYTSISVREPLANIRAQTKEMNKTKRSLDPHYSTVSDDSDEMYTTIPDQNNQIYTSGSETYAQIQPITVAVDINPVPSSSMPSTANEVSDTPDAFSSAAPQPPSVDSLKNISHSRQADQDIFPASSTSSILNLGSPKPEKRQANSPLPPPPGATSPDFLLYVEKHKNLDDMYAKVHKNKKKSEELDKSLDSIVSCGSPTEELKIENEKAKREHNYETLKKSPRKNSDPGYEKLRLKDDCSEPGYASINGPDSLNTDPGYEVLNRKAGSDVDPNYEQVCDRNAGYSTIKDSLVAGYSVVNKQHKLNLKQLQEKTEEPNYESMPDGSEPGYIKSGSETDPNYESVNQNDPNYESVKYLDVTYEMKSTDDDSSRTDSRDNNNSGYELVDSNNSSTEKDSNDPPYEKLNNDDNSNSESSGYEKICNQSELKQPDYETIKRDKSKGDCMSEDEDGIFEV